MTPVGRPLPIHRLLDDVFEEELVCVGVLIEVVPVANVNPFVV